MWRYFVPLLLFAVLAVFFRAGLNRNPQDIPSPLIGQPAPTFSLPDVKDAARQVSIADYHGRAFLLNVWASWCVSCRDEQEMLLAIAADKKIPIVGLNWKDQHALAQRWLKELGDPYEAVAFDPDGKAGMDWGVYGAPETFLIGADGRVLYKLTGPLTAELWREEFLPRLASNAAP
jgi:cytochrome c biogenesis protein CcmG/thiol:disulfide interchange protein DsbE